MALIASLPEELLSMVFNKINDLNTLAECRLACKAWSVLAEKAMLSTVTITTYTNKTRSLYEVLDKDPKKAYWIKHLDFDNCMRTQDDCIIGLLYLALTPSIESITGCIWDAGIISTVTSVFAEGSSNKFDRLKTLTVSSCGCEPPLELALHCRSTIQTFELNFTSGDTGLDWNFVDKLDEFINLTSLELAVKIGTISKLDRLLSKCQQLQKLSLSTLNWELALDWDQQRIERNTNLKVLSIPAGECPIKVLDYLLYKYPSIECISVNASIDDSFGEEYILRVPRLLQRVSQRELIYTILENADIRFILRCLINNDFKITVKKPDLFNGICIKVDY